MVLKAEKDPESWVSGLAVWAGASYAVLNILECCWTPTSPRSGCWPKEHPCRQATEPHSEKTAGTTVAGMGQPHQTRDRASECAVRIQDVCWGSHAWDHSTAQEEEKKPCQKVRWSELVPTVPEDTPAEDKVLTA